MNRSEIDAIADWIVQSGLSGAGEMELLNGFCARCEQGGLSLASAIAVIDTLHPIWEGRAFRWRNDGVQQDPMIEYGRTTASGEAAERWQKSSFHYLLTTGQNEVRRRIGFGDPIDFYSLDELAANRHTDYFALVHRFANDGDRRNGLHLLALDHSKAGGLLR